MMKLDIKNKDRRNQFGARVTDHVSAMLAYWDKNLVCRFSNSAYSDWFGKTPDDMIDKITLPELLGPVLLEKNLPYILGALEGKVQTFEREIPIPRSGGGIRYALANYFPDIENNEVKGFFVHVADITPVKLLENELIKSNTIRKEQNERLLGFANIVSHDLRSYANNLQSILDIFINAGSEKEKDEMLNYLKVISKGFSSTVNNLSEIVKIHNLANVNIEKLVLYDCVEKAIDILKIQIRSTQAVVKNNVDKNVTLFANPAYLGSIILNLLTNAIKYKDPDRTPVIEIDTVTDNKELIFSVKDNGRGINLEKHRKDLFGMYKTFHQNPDAKGIGLFITKMQVESMGGRIEVESQESKGTTFSIHFGVSKV